MCPMDLSATKRQGTRRRLSLVVTCFAGFLAFILFGMAQTNGETTYRFGEPVEAVSTEKLANSAESTPRVTQGTFLAVDDTGAKTDDLDVDESLPVATVPETVTTGSSLLSGIRLGRDTELSMAGEDSPQTYSDEMYQSLRDDLSKDLGSWKKEGGFEIVPYGILWGSVSTETHPSNIGSACFWLQPPSETGTVSYVDYRGTILGTAIEGPEVPLFGNRPVTGKVEFDLQRTLDFENKTTVHLRHCFIEVRDEEFRLLIGQTWDVVSPLVPGTLMYNAGWFSGNSGYRRGQLRGERYFNHSDWLQTKTEFALAAPFSADVNIPGAITQKSSSMPMIQGRAAVVFGERGEGGRPIEMGIASHYVPYKYRLGGETDEVDSHGIFLDMKVPILEKFGVQGEYFYGQNLGSLLANIGEGVNLDPNGQLIGVTGNGGWVSLWYDLTDKSQIKCGWCVDDPNNNDLIPATASTNLRTRNEHIFGNISYRLTKQFLVGFEYSHWETEYRGADEGTSSGNRFDFVSVYGF